MLFNKKSKDDIMESSQAKQDNFVVSTEAMERYKKHGEIHGYGGLSNYEIEVLFSDADWKKQIESGEKEKAVFDAALEKKSSRRSYSYVIFYRKNDAYFLKTDRGDHLDSVDLWLDNCIFNGSVIIQREVKGESTFVDIKNCHFLGGLAFGGNAEFKLRVDNCIFDGDFFLKDAATCSELSLSHCKCNGSLPNNVREIFLEKVSCKRIETIYLNKATLMNVEIDGYISFKNKEKNIIDSIKIEDSAIKSDFYIFDKVNRFSMTGSNMLEPFTIWDSSSLLIANSSLMEAEFYNCECCNVEGSHFKELSISSKSQYDDSRGMNTVFIYDTKVEEKLNINIASDALIIKQCSDLGVVNASAKSMEIKESKINILNISSAKSLDIFKLTVDEVKIHDGLIDNLFFKNSKVNGVADFSYLKIPELFVVAKTKFYGELDLRFSDINKMAFYKSSFHQLNLDCAFNDQSKFSYLTGLNDEGNIQKLDESNFASEESWDFFNKSKHYESTEDDVESCTVD